MEEGITVDKDNSDVLGEFNQYFTDILFGLRSRGINVSESEILAYLLENISHHLKIDRTAKAGSKIRSINDILGDMDEIATNILYKKYPMLDSDNLKSRSKLQRLINRKPIQNLPINVIKPVYITLLILNWLYVLFISFMGLNASFTLIVIATNDAGISDTFQILNGSLVLYYDILFQPIILSIWGLTSFVLSFLTLFVFYTAPIRRSVENLSNRIFQFRSFMFLNFLSFTFFSTYLILGAIGNYDGVSVNGLDFVNDLLIPFIIGFSTITLSAIISIKMVLDLPNNSRPLIKDNVVKRMSYRFFRVVIVLISFVLLYALLGLYQDTATQFSLVTEATYRFFWVDLTWLYFSSLVLTSLYILLVYFVRLFQISEFNSWMTFMLRVFLIHVLMVVLFCGFLYVIFNQVMAFDQGQGRTVAFSYDAITNGLVKFIVPQTIPILILLMNKNKGNH